MVRPIPTYPLNFSQESSNFQQVNTINANNQGIVNPPVREVENAHLQTAFVSGEPQYPVVSDVTSMVIHLPPRSMVDVSVNFIGPSQQVTQFGFLFNILHSSRVPVMTTSERQTFRLIPTVSGNCPTSQDSVNGVVVPSIKSLWRPLRTILVQQPMTRSNQGSWSEIKGFYRRF